jgi:hypothetical protein
MTEDQYVKLLCWVEEWAPEVEFRLYGAVVNPKTGKFSTPRPRQVGSSPESIVAGPITPAFWKVVLTTFPNYTDTTIACSRSGYVSVTIWGSVDYGAALQHHSNSGGKILGKGPKCYSSSSIIPKEEWEEEP